MSTTLCGTCILALASKQGLLKTLSTSRLSTSRKLRFSRHIFHRLWSLGDLGAQMVLKDDDIDVPATLCRIGVWTSRLLLDTAEMTGNNLTSRSLGISDCAIILYSRGVVSKHKQPERTSEASNPACHPKSSMARASVEVILEEYH
eukprot:6487841-Amphidinium_carterae.1